MSKEPVIDTKQIAFLEEWNHFILKVNLMNHCKLQSGEL